jgi:hypothetical protein
MIVALLIVPIYLLYNLVKDTDGKLDDHATGVCIAILLVCTLLFSAVLSVFTRAKRHEILGAAAAYVLVGQRRLTRWLNYTDPVQVLRCFGCVLGKCEWRLAIWYRSYTTAALPTTLTAAEANGHFLQHSLRGFDWERFCEYVTSAMMLLPAFTRSYDT